MLSKKAFTLIELLVVVLIIGILAAVAVSQYQKAVERSQAMPKLALLKSLALAQEAYFLENGTYADRFDKLAVSLPGDWQAGGSFFAWRTADNHKSGEWVIQMDKEVGDIILGRAEGKYRGASFYYRAGDKTIECVEFEYPAGNLSFEPTDDAYCAKIMQGKYLQTDRYVLRRYTLP